MAIELSAFDAFLFDLDGVITRTAGLHAAAWKKLFEDYLVARAAGTDTPVVPFDIVADYRAHVDGKPRHAGIRDFLASRGIRLPEGTPQDDESRDTVQGLGKRKNRYFLASLEEEGVRVYGSAIALVREARARGVKTAVVSSGRNTTAILRVARAWRICSRFASTASTSCARDCPASPIQPCSWRLGGASAYDRPEASFSRTPPWASKRAAGVASASWSGWALPTRPSACASTALTPSWPISARSV